jgi:SAM-dependent methyltransferase
MSGFSPEWLALREPVDHRSRHAGLAGVLAGRLNALAAPRIVDLGCGTGSNLRGTAPLLGPRQSWTLVDYDPRLLAVARDRLAGWADCAAAEGDALVLEKAGKRIEVRFRQADLVRDLGAALGDAPKAWPDLVTASALFDLCSAEFIQRFAAAVAARKAAFFTVLTYDGVQSWTPTHAADEAMRAAFIAHQKTDKGFGTSAGPDAPSALRAAFEANGYAVREGDSPWVLGDAEAALVRDLADGFAGAVAETGNVTPGTIADWRTITRTGAIVGHTDTLALPPA